MRWRNTKKGVKKEVHTKSLDAFVAIAPFSKRLKAFVVDSFMLLMPILYVVFYLVFGSRQGFSEHMLLGWFLILLPYGCVSTLFLYRSLQTPGYKAYDLELRCFESEKKPTFMLLLARYAINVVTAITIIGLFVPLFRSDKLGISDIFTHTAPFTK